MLQVTVTMCVYPRSRNNRVRQFYGRIHPAYINGAIFYFIGDGDNRHFTYEFQLAALLCACSESLCKSRNPEHR